MQAIEQLQSLINDSNDRELAFDTAQSYSLSKFQHDITRCIGSLKTKPHGSYLLFVDNSYCFAVNLLSLLLLNKKVVLTANNKPDWLDEIADSHQAVITHAPRPGDIHALHYTDTQSSLPANQLKLPEVVTSTIQFYTSGSSSTPKAISKSISQILLEVDTLEAIFGKKLGSCDILASVSHHHIYGLIFRLLWPLLYQRSFFTDIILYPEQLIELIEQRPKSCLISSPAFLSRQDYQLAKVSLNHCFSSGSLLSASAAEAAYHQLNTYPIEVFGSTETGGIGYRTQRDSNTNWTLFPGVTIQVPDQQQAILNSPYLTRPQKLDDKIKLLQNDQFELLGRIDRVVKIEEKRVSLDAVEAALCNTKWVKQAKLVVLQQQRSFIGAVIQLTPEGQTFLKQQSKLQLNNHLKQLLKQKFEAVAIPRKWRYLEQLPYNSQGKLPVTALMELF